MKHPSPAGIPTILFGAFDRHNFGDLLFPHIAAALITRLDSRPGERREWAQKLIGIPDLAPYTLSRQRFPQAARVIYNGVGGIDLAQRDPALRSEVLAKLKSADVVSVRDELTLAQLSAAGVTASLVPDPAVMVAELFGARIRHQARQGSTAAMRGAFQSPPATAWSFSALAPRRGMTTWPATSASWRACGHPP